MDNLIAGLVGVTMVVVFLGYYAISLNSAPLWVIIGAILFMVCRDYYQSARKGKKKSEE
jgi:Flp pilus assembly protein TadB